jgi:hypothetical protein
LPFSQPRKHIAAFVLCSGEKRYNVKLRAGIFIISICDFAEFRRLNRPAPQRKKNDAGANAFTALALTIGIFASRDLYPAFRFQTHTTARRGPLTPNICNTTNLIY